ncbi:ATP-dependent RecD-like DNA helicase [Oribacterium sp. P9]|uniref:SF1B family DNA helicase RecD2 n=1 Tax=unclassified Oribacterium TaxID=2629782 RepID=UPI002A7C35E3|nr:ATP-dependent RecD-like DNA helicase [Oribacterium sp.]MDD6518986.1 ATP-dependent RecD-like DNA helicase [Oribacterium sp.]MDY2853888.1 ATP-dependent RecD-like DNA helicase [Oliverpabstia sp.]
MEYFEGYIDHIIFQSPATGYTVMTGVMEGKTYTLVGTLPGIEAGENIKADGHEATHQIYGTQFVIDQYQVVAPKTQEAVERYLGSGAIKGIGAAMASRIVKKFGDDTMRIIEEEPERLAEIKGISARKAMDIAASVNAKRDMQDAVMFLQKYGISINLAGKIYNRYGNEMYDIVRDNPYRLAEDIEGLGFRTCDEIARNAGIAEDSAFRIESGIQYALGMAEGNGHCYLPLPELWSSVESLLNITIQDLNQYLLELQMKGRVMVKSSRPRSISDFLDSAANAGDADAPVYDANPALHADPATHVYRATIYYTELQVATLLKDLNVTVENAELDAKRALTIDEITEKHGIELDPLQRDAVLTAGHSGLLVITGGPGTGKTTTINTIIRMFADEGKTILLGAPTGRAAKRMSEATGWPASTIHRLLEYQGRPDEDGEDGDQVRGHFERNENNPLECDVVIIDEMSMVDIFLMNALLKAIHRGTRLIMVGDANQLPSVGAGNVLRDIIASGVIRTIQLRHIFRQAAASDIVVNAHKINEGEPVDLSKRSKDFLFIKSQTPDQIFAAIAALVLNKLPGYLGVDPFDIQIMTPQRKGALGVERLNQLLQEQMNPKSSRKTEKEIGGTLFRVGDKVMQIRNDYNLIWEIRGRYGIPTEKGEGVFNGDIGIITEINSFAQNLTVRFDDRFVEYAFKDCESLELAYAITIHKSQGSEYPAVIVPMYQGPSMLMNRNLLYTAVTRAKSCVCLVGNPPIFDQMLHNASEAKRYSSLGERLQEVSHDENSL